MKYKTESVWHYGVLISSLMQPLFWGAKRQSAVDAQCVELLVLKLLHMGKTSHFAAAVLSCSIVMVPCCKHSPVTLLSTPVQLDINANI